MRGLWRSLTSRGRGWASAGLVALAAGVVLGQQALTYVGIVATLVPALSAWLMARSGFRLSLQRTVTPSLIRPGDQARVQLDISSVRTLTYGRLLLEEQLPAQWELRPRFTVAATDHTPVTYQLTAQQRGVYQLGPLTVGARDPLGLVHLRRAFRGVTPLTVAPHTVPLGTKPPHALAETRGDEQLHAFAVGSPEDVTVREYREGDDLRRIHWPSSARTGALMVRNEEQPWQAEATVVLDTRPFPDLEGLELAISVAASVCEHLVELGYGVRLLWPDGDLDLDSSATALSALAQVEPARSMDLTRWPRDAGRGLVVAVLGELRTHDLAEVRSWRHGAWATYALCLSADTGDAVAHQGWRTALVHELADLPRAWDAAVHG